MSTGVPRIVIAGLSGDGGKTMTTLSVVAALRARGLSVATFKKGPDYIDPSWIGRVGGTECRNLDTCLVEPRRVLERFVRHAARSDVAVVEGNRGMYDGRDARGTHSTAELARLIGAPVVLVVDARKVTRTAAALVKGCVAFDRDVNVAGVVLNRVAGPRHERILRESIEEYAGVPVVGAVPVLDGAVVIPGRHLGLVPPTEFTPGAIELETALRGAASYLDIDAILRIAAHAAPLPPATPDRRRVTAARARVGYFGDDVFTFYYPENLEALEAAGAEVVRVSSTDDPALPPVDALYIGGGFPETHAQALSRNRSMMTSVREAALAGLPVYAECGGLIYLARSLTWRGTRFPMAGLFPVDLLMHDKPVGHGYTLARIDRPNPFYAVGDAIRGHEFHYSGCADGAPGADTCMAMETGTGLGGRRDGLVVANAFASYTHVHADSTGAWAPAIVQRAAAYATQRDEGINVERQSTWQK